MEEVDIDNLLNAEIEQRAAQRASDRARAARWDLDVAVFFFAVLLIVIILLFEGIGIEIVAPSAAGGLALGWLMGWRKGRQLYERLYEEELSKLQLASKIPVDENGETPEEKVQKVLRERFRR